MDADDLAQAVRLMSATLGPLTGRDWSAAAGTLDWTCRQTLAHIGHDLLAYAAQVAGRAQDTYLPLDLVVRDDAPVPAVLAAAEACGGLLVAALRTAPPDMRAWHFGPCDAGGFAALGAAEILLHTYDITCGLRVEWSPPGPLSAAIRDRLAPDAPGPDPAQALLRHTGRLGDGGPWRWRMTPAPRRAARPGPGPARPAAT